MKRKKEDMEGLEIVTPRGAVHSDRAQKKSVKLKKSCDRCGTCCSEGSPVLLKEDLRLFTSGVLSYDSAYSVREGELLRSHRDNELYESRMDLIKVKEKEGTAECTFYEGRAGCRIYENRPEQCRAYACWAPHEMMTGLEELRLTRKDLFDSLETLLQIMARHEEKCSYQRLSDAVEKVSGGDETAVEDIMDMLQYDTYARPFLEEKFHIPRGAMDLLLGRPLVDTIRSFGLKVVTEGDEHILVPVEVVYE